MNIARSTLGPLALLCLVVVKPHFAEAQTKRARAAPVAAITSEEKKRQASDIAVQIVTSGITCTCARFAEDIRDVVNDLRPGGLRVLPVLGVGGLQTLEDVLFLKGIDIGVIDEDRECEAIVCRANHSAAGLNRVQPGTSAERLISFHFGCLEFEWN